MTYHEVTGTRHPIRMWAEPEAVDPQAMQQLRNVADLPWVHGVAVMPDVHHGKGATVGSVIAMRDAVSPAAVGVDIGCGMTAVKTSYKASQLPDNLAYLRGKLEQAVPVGFAHHKRPVDPGKVFGMKPAGWAEFWNRFDELASAVKARRERAEAQMGTLGGGNHFLEVCADGEGMVWVVLHSGSRNIGKELAEHHIGVARGLSHNQGLVDRDLAVFVGKTPEMDAYRRDLFWAQDYARRNRSLMMGLVCDVLRRHLPNITFDQPISCHHNFSSGKRYVLAA